MPVPGKNPAEPSFNAYGLTDGMLTLVGQITPSGAPPGTTNAPPYRIGTIGQSKALLLIAGLAQSKIIPGSSGLTIRDNTDSFDNLTISNGGNIVARGTITALSSGIGSGTFMGTPGTASSANTVIGTYTGIADNTATATLTFSVPNIALAATINVIVLASLGAGGAVGAFETSRFGQDQLGITRVAGITCGKALGTIVETGQATVAGADTLTLTLAIGATTGGATATQTFSLNVTIAKGAGASDNHRCVMIATILNATAGGVTITA